MRKIGAGRYQQVYKSGPFVIKIANLESNPKNQITKIEKYYQELCGKGICVPKYYGARVNNSKLETKWNFCGPSLTDVYREAGKIKRDKLLLQLIEYSKLAEEIAFYPLFEQFTVKNGQVFFVDFYPSRTQEDFASYSEEKRDALKKKFFGYKGRLKTINRESLKYS